MKKFFFSISLIFFSVCLQAVNFDQTKFRSLDVSGTANINGALDVSGNINGTTFTGDGSALTGVGGGSISTGSITNVHLATGNFEKITGVGTITTLNVFSGINLGNASGAYDGQLKFEDMMFQGQNIYQYNGGTGDETLYINYYGQNGTTGVFRNTEIANGKGGTIALFEGSEAYVKLHSALLVGADASGASSGGAKFSNDVTVSTNVISKTFQVVADTIETVPTGSNYVFYTSNTEDNLLNLRRYPDVSHSANAYFTLLRLAAPPKVGSSLPAESTIAMAIGDGNSDSSLEAEISTIDWYNNHYVVGSGGGKTYDSSQVETTELNYSGSTAKDKMQYGIRQFLHDSSAGASQNAVMKPFIVDICDNRTDIGVGNWKMIQIDPKTENTATSNNVIKLFGKTRIIRDTGVADVFQASVNDRSIGINANAPTDCQLLVSSNSSAFLKIQGTSDGDNCSGFQLWNNTADHKWEFSHATGNGFKISHYNSGWSFPLQITSQNVTTLTGNLIFSGLAAAGSGTDLVIDGSNNIIPKTSSRRFKNSIRDLTINSNLIYKLRPVEFRYNGSEKNEIGLIAEEVAAIIPDVVNFDKSGKPYSIKYDEFVPIIIQELKKKNDQLQRLEDEIFKLKNRK